MDSIFGDIEYNEATKVAIAKMVDTIYSLSKFENCETDFISTKRFVEKDYIQNMSKVDYEIINNLKSTWNSIINNNDILELNLSSLKSLNKSIGENIIPNNGKLRRTDVTINGLSKECLISPTSEPILENNIREFLNQGTDIEKNIILAGAYIIKSQPFLDGNKRSSFLFMNLALIKKNIIHTENLDSKVSNKQKM